MVAVATRAQGKIPETFWELAFACKPTDPGAKDSAAREEEPSHEVLGLQVN